MLSSNFKQIFESYPQVNRLFDGVFAINTIPKKLLKVKHFIVCNTDTDTGPGKHWFCILRSSRNTIECFDSLGITNEKKTFLFNLFKAKPFIREIKINVDRIQSLTSETCGEFVIFFLFERLHNQDMSYDELINECFSTNIDQNENSVTSFYKEMFENV